MTIQEVADALEKARSCFHGVAAALSGHLNGHWDVDWEKMLSLLQQRNQETSTVLETLIRDNQYTPPWGRVDKPLPSNDLG